MAVSHCILVYHYMMHIPKVIKITSVIIGAIAALLILAAVIAPFLIDSDTYRKEIARYVEETTGRTLTIGDDMELSLFPWIGFKLGAVTLENREGFSPRIFASLEQASVKVKLMPLLEQRVEVDKITLHGLKLHLQVDEQGLSNWSDLIPGSTGVETPSKPADKTAGAALPIAALVIGGIDLRNAHLTWDDRQSNSTYTIDRLNLSSSLITPNKPFEVKADFRVEASGIEGNIDIQTRLTMDLAKQRYRANALRLAASLRGTEIPSNGLALQLASDISADLETQTLDIANLQIKGLGLQGTGKIHGRGILESPRFEGALDIPAFQPRKLLEALALPAVETADPKALGNASLKLQFQATDNALKISRLSGALDETRLEGHASIQNFTKPAMAFALKLDAIDMDRYLPPAAEDTPAGTPASAAAAGALDLPVEDLRALKLQGDLAIGKAIVSGLTITDFSVKLAARNGLIKLSPIQAALYEGRYEGNMTLDVRKDTPRFAIDEKLTGVQAAPLLKDFMEDDILSGRGDVSIKLASLGNDMETIKKNLGGDAAFSFRDGAVKGVNLAQLIRKAKAALKNSPLPPEKARQQTDFTELGGTIQINKGIARNSDLEARSPYFRISGQGQADLVREKIDYMLHARVVGTGIGQTEKELDDLKGVDIPVRVEGDLMNPDFKVDKEFITKLLRSKAEKRLKKKLDREQEKILKDVEEQLQDTLKGLFR